MNGAAYPDAGQKRIESSWTTPCIGINCPQTVSLILVYQRPRNFLSPRTRPALAVSIPVDSQIEVENALIDFLRVCNNFLELRVVFVSFRIELR
ncbi:MAG: hypothetical protein WBA40_05630 [Roseiarcus sp.]